MTTPDELGMALGDVQAAYRQSIKELLFSAAPLVMGALNVLGLRRQRNALRAALAAPAEPVPQPEPDPVPEPERPDDGPPDVVAAAERFVDYWIPDEDE